MARGRYKLRACLPLASAVLQCSPVLLLYVARLSNESVVSQGNPRRVSRCTAGPV